LVLDHPFYQPVHLSGFFHMRQVSSLLEDVLRYKRLDGVPEALAAFA